MKKIYNLILILSMFLSITSFSVNVYAMEDNNKYPIFKEYITKCFNDQEGTTIIYDNEDVTLDFFDKYKNDFNNNQFENMHNFINDEKCTITYLPNSNISPYATQAISKVFDVYQSATDTSGSFTKEWTIKMKCYVIYDANKYVVTSSKNPILELGSNAFCAAFTPYIDSNSVSTSYTIASNKLSVNFKGSYKLKCGYSPVIGVSKTLDFKKHSITKTVKI